MPTEVAAPQVDWTLVLLSPGLEELSNLAPTKTTLRWERNRGAVVKGMTLPHDTEGAAEFATARSSGTPILLAYRRDSAHNEDDPQPRFGGKLQSIETELDAQSGVPYDEVKWADPLGVPLETSTNSDDFNEAAASIVETLIETENAEAPCGLVIGSVASSTPVRERAYNLQTIASAIYELADLGDFETQITYVDPRTNDGALAILDLAAAGSVGSDLSSTVRLEAGDGTAANVLSVSEQTIPPVNKVTGTIRRQGGYPGDPLAGATVAYTISDGASIVKHGKFELNREIPDALNDADLGDKARALLRPEWTSSVVVTPDPATAPQPFVDFWICDTLGFLVDTHQMQIDGSEQVVAVEIDLDENLQESAFRVEYGEPRRTELQLIQGLAERVYFLEHPNA